VPDIPTNPTPPALARVASRLVTGERPKTRASAPRSVRCFRSGNSARFAGELEDLIAMSYDELLQAGCWFVER
jgi:hypothetical protein